MPPSSSATPPYLLSNAASKSKPLSVPAPGTTSPSSGTATPDSPGSPPSGAVRPEALPTPAARRQLIADLTASRDHGLANIEALVAEWTPRIALLPATIRAYLTENIHYTLDPACIQTIALFRQLAAQTAILDPLPNLPFLLP